MILTLVCWQKHLKTKKQKLSFLLFVPVTVQFSNYIFKDLLHLYKLKDTLRNEGLSDYEELISFNGSNTNHSILLTRN